MADAVSLVLLPVADVDVAVRLDQATKAVSKVIAVIEALIDGPISVEKHHVAIWVSITISLTR